jgi:hypothetical protein
MEMALSLLFLLPLLYGTIQFGLGLHYYAELLTAVRTGARYASSRTYDAPGATPSAAFLSAVRNMTVYGNPAGGTRAVVPALSVENVVVSMTMRNGAPRSINVRIDSFPLHVVFTTYRLSKPEAEFPYLGVFAPAGSGGK